MARDAEHLDADSLPARARVLIAAVDAWTPKGHARPTVELEAWSRGLRVKLIYRGVGTGMLFTWGGVEGVHATLDRVFEVLAWRVTQGPKPGHEPIVKGRVP
jgi:hypothetical protein